MAAQDNALDDARLLIDRGADINVKTDGITPLQMAGAVNSLDVATRLIDRGVNTEGVDLSCMN